MKSHFRKSQIIGYLYIDGRRVTYLKPGVRKRFYPDYTSGDFMPQLNQELIWSEKIEKFMKIVMGEDEFENE